MGREECPPERFLPRFGPRRRLRRQDPPGENLLVVHGGEADPADPLPEQVLLGGVVDLSGPQVVKASEKNGELPRRDVLRDPQRRDVPAVEHLGEARNQGMVTPEEAVPEEHPVPRDAQEEHPGRFAAGLPGKGRAERVDSPGENRMPGSVQAGPMMHAGDVEQQLLDSLGSRVQALNLHPDALLPKSIVPLIGRERGNLAEKRRGDCASPANSRGCVDVRIMYNQQMRERGRDSAAREMYGEAR